MNQIANDANDNDSTNIKLDHVNKDDDYLSNKCEDETRLWGNTEMIRDDNHEDNDNDDDHDSHDDNAEDTEENKNDTFEDDLQNC